MSEYLPILNWIQTQRPMMTDLVVAWARINSHTFHKDGLETLTEEVIKSFSIFNEEIKRVTLAPFSAVDQTGGGDQHALADVLIIQKRPEAAKRVLLVCHMDTVYPPDHHFQEVKILDDYKIEGPGVADAKGGMVIMLKMLEAIEQSPHGKNIGWTVMINSDEEVGSPSSAHLIEEVAAQCRLGLVFEPCLSNGHLVGARKGSINGTLMATGKAAHAGRNITQGKNAIDALAQCISRISMLNGRREGLTVNIGIIKGGTACNVVAEKAVAGLNIRFLKEADILFVKEQMDKITADISKKTGVGIKYERRISAVPKTLTGKTLNVFKHLQRCGKDLSIDIQWEDSGGVCDGNRLQAAGLPTVDTLGVVGGGIHSDQEYLLVDSLVERTKLAALCLLKWASDEWDI